MDNVICLTKNTNGLNRTKCASGKIKLNLLHICALFKKVDMILHKILYKMFTYIMHWY